MSIDVSIILKGPKEFEEGPDVIVSEAIDYIPGETVEQLISRLLYRYREFYSGTDPRLKQRVYPRGAAHEQAIELRLVRKIL